MARPTWPTSSRLTPRPRTLPKPCTIWQRLRVRRQGLTEAKRWYTPTCDASRTTTLAAACARLRRPLEPGRQSDGAGRPAAQNPSQSSTSPASRARSSSSITGQPQRTVSRTTSPAQAIADAVGAKQNVELVSINLDDTPPRRRNAIPKTEAPGIHLYQRRPTTSGGSNSPLATQYGIHILPTLFMVDRDGRVTWNRSLQIGDIETELKKVQSTIRGSPGPWSVASNAADYGLFRPVNDRIPHRVPTTGSKSTPDRPMDGRGRSASRLPAASGVLAFHISMHFLCVPVPLC